ncbi:MAG: hypothetical protein E7370_02980 [Clostridiales bacterium]|nr:hypothetical protein [Clostridiales bacterium]
MLLKICVNSSARDSDYGGEQILQIKKGEFVLDEIFRLHFFRLIIDEIIDGAVCFRLMEGATPHYFVLEPNDRIATFERETSIGYDFFKFELI